MQLSDPLVSAAKVHVEASVAESRSLLIQSKGVTSAKWQSSTVVGRKAMHSLADRGKVEQQRALWASTIAVTIGFAHVLQHANAAAGLALFTAASRARDRAAASLQYLAALPQDSPHCQVVAHVGEHPC